MTLLSVNNRLEPIEYMESLDYWTEYSLECYWRQLVIECQMMNATGTTETEKNEETGKSDDLPPFDYVNYWQGEIGTPS